MLKSVCVWNQYLQPDRSLSLIHNAVPVLIQLTTSRRPNSNNDTTKKPHLGRANQRKSQASTRVQLSRVCMNKYFDYS